MKIPVRHQSLEVEGTGVSVQAQSSVGDRKQHQRLKDAAATAETELSLQQFQAETDELEYNLD